MEAGAISENIYSQANALGLVRVAIGAFNDDAFNKVLEVDGLDEAALSIMPVAFPR